MVNKVNLFGQIGNAFNFIISRPLGYILYWCYFIARNYGLALIIFTLVTRVLLWPLAVKQQKSQAEMARFQPKIAELQKKYGNDKQKMQDAQMKLYQEEGYNPMSGCLPMLIQLPIIWGLFNVIYKPYTYILGYSSEIITKLVTALKEPLIALGQAAGNTFGSSSPSIASMVSNQKIEILLAGAIKNNPTLVSGIVPKTAFTLDFNFLGLDLTRTPDFTSIYLIFPILCYVTQFISTWMSMKLTQASQPNTAATSMTNKSMLVIMPLMTTIFAFQFPAAITLYWITTNVFMMLQVVLLNKFYSFDKLNALAEAQSESRRAKRMAQIEKMEQLTGRKMNGQPLDSNTQQSAQSPKPQPGAKAQQGAKPQQSGQYQQKKKNTSGKPSKKQLMEENRRRLSAARELEKKRAAESGKGEE
jgi:YidC/Oxa1 family membrane protein insertase